jgi:hypothetical protein
MNSAHCAHDHEALEIAQNRSICPALLRVGYAFAPRRAQEPLAPTPTIKDRLRRGKPPMTRGRRAGPGDAESGGASRRMDRNRLTPAVPHPDGHEIKSSMIVIWLAPFPVCLLQVHAVR